MNIHGYKKEGNLGTFHKVVLMSKSPRRRELLSFLSPSFMSSSCDELAVLDKYLEEFQEDAFLERLGKVSCELARAKSSEKLKADILYISADTMVLMDGKVYNKPKDREEAYQMLRSYFGKSHYVVTGVCLKTAQGEDTFYSLCEVSFIQYHEYLESFIQQYIDRGSPMDKAGAYGIQDMPPFFLSSIKGDYFTIVGLPVGEIVERLDLSML